KYAERLLDNNGYASTDGLPPITEWHRFQSLVAKHGLDLEVPNVDLPDFIFRDVPFRDVGQRLRVEVTRYYLKNGLGGLLGRVCACAHLIQVLIMWSGQMPPSYAARVGIAHRARLKLEELPRAALESPGGTMLKSVIDEIDL